MRFMMMIKPSGDMDEAGYGPGPDDVAAMMAYNEELTKAGVLLALDGLHPSAKGAKVRFSGGKPTVTDGPFTEAKELIGGYWIIDVKSKEEAVEWAKRVPATADDGLRGRGPAGRRDVRLPRRRAGGGGRAFAGASRADDGAVAACRRPPTPPSTRSGGSSPPR